MAQRLLRWYSYPPYLFFIFIGGCYVYAEVAWGGISWQNYSAPYATGYEVFNPFADALLIPAVAGMALLPLLLLFKLLLRRGTGWGGWLPAIVSYGLMFAFVYLAGYMGWWGD